MILGIRECRSGRRGGLRREPGGGRRILERPVCLLVQEPPGPVAEEEEIGLAVVVVITGHRARAGQLCRGKGEDTAVLFRRRPPVVPEESRPGRADLDEVEIAVVVRVERDAPRRFRSARLGRPESGRNVPVAFENVTAGGAVFTYRARRRWNAAFAGTGPAPDTFASRSRRRCCRAGTRTASSPAGRLPRVRRASTPARRCKRRSRCTARPSTRPETAGGLRRSGAAEAGFLPELLLVSATGIEPASTTVHETGDRVRRRADPIPGASGEARSGDALLWRHCKSRQISMARSMNCFFGSESGG